MNRWIVAAILITALPSIGISASADEGRTEINQARALAGGITPGDTPGFPVWISQPGSYVLTGPLTVPDENTDAIDVVADGVTIDLGGFEISGPTVCQNTGSGLSCTPSGSGTGVNGLRSRLTVRDGFVRGMGYNGVSVAGMSFVENVTANSNGRAGIVANGGSVTTSRASYNGTNGIELGSRSSVQGSLANGNGGFGVFANGSSNVIGNSIGLNQSYGLFSGGVAGPVGYGTNVLTYNNGGPANPQVSGAAIEIGPNICGDDTVCP